MNRTAQMPGSTDTTQPSTKRIWCLFIVQIALLSLLTYTTLLPTHNAHAQGETAIIQIVSQTPGFSPALLTVHVFDYVIFINQTSPATNVSISADDGSFSSPAIASGKQWATTFNSPGAYEYHDTTNPPHMVGEIVVVASSVALLTTPAPEVEATAIALIQAGKTPPDNLALFTPTPTTTTPARPQQESTTLPLVSKFPPWLIAYLLIGESVLLLAIFIASFLLIRSYRRRLRKFQRKNAVELEAPIAEKVGVRQKLFHRFKRKKDDDEDEDEGEEDYDDEA